MVSSNIQKRNASPCVYIGIESPTFGGSPYPRQCSQVGYACKPVGREYLLKSLLIPDVGVNDNRMPGKRGDIGPLHSGIIVIIEVINDDDFVILPQQPCSKLTANEPCSTGD